MTTCLSTETKQKAEKASENLERLLWKSPGFSFLATFFNFMRRKGNKIEVNERGNFAPRAARV